jgi:rhodanese-related sulfurtransferase
VTELKNGLGEVLLLDVREKQEFEVSHIPGAQWAGYNDFDISAYDEISKDQPIVVYCSVGYRSEKVGETLRNAGYSNVRNLYGSLFEWVNQGNVVEEKGGHPTTRIHTYNRKWSQWMFNENYVKVW